MKKRIVNADDFGASSEINTAIDYAFKQGIINQATLMTNMPHAQDAVYKAISGGYINKLGLHLCLDLGEPFTSTIKEYNLFGNKAFWGKRINRLYISKKVREAIEQEIEAQMKEYLRFGCTAMHIDSHHHVHHNPSILPSVIKLAKKYGFKSMRISRNIGPGIPLFNRIAKKFLNSIIAKNFETNKYFGNMQNYKETSLKRDDSFEIMVHPCIKDEKYLDWINFDSYYNLDDYQILKPEDLL